MDENKILADVAETVTEKPKDVVITVKPKNWFERFLIKKGWMKSKHEFDVTPITYGNFIKIAGKAIGINPNIDTENFVSTIMAAAAKHGDDIIYIVAVGITNTPNEPSRALKRLIANQFTNEDIEATLYKILNRSGLQSFTNTIALIAGVKILQKEKASPMEGGS